MIGRGDEAAVPPLHPSKKFGQTPPPSDGSVIACPKCVKGRRRIGFYRRPCPDCLGTGVRGYGFSALRVFEEWVSNSSPDGDG